MEREQLKFLHENRKFMIWLITHFEYDPGIKEQITVYELLDIYKACYPKSELDEQMLARLLRTTGFITTAANCVPVTPKNTVIQNFPVDVLQTMLKVGWASILKDKIRIHLRKNQVIDRMNEKRTLTPMERKMLLEEKSIELFYDLWCIDTRIFPYADELVYSYDKAPVGVVRKAYNTFCKDNNLRAQDWKLLKEYLEAKGHIISRGYACKTSGQSLVKYLFVPGSLGIQDLAKASAYGMIVFHRVNGDYTTNTGALLPNNYEERIEMCKQIVQERLYLAGLVEDYAPVRIPLIQTDNSALINETDERDVLEVSCVQELETVTNETDESSDNSAQITDDLIHEENLTDLDSDLDSDEVSDSQADVESKEEFEDEEYLKKRLADLGIEMPELE